MAIQDLINEINSIQSKKQSIKEAITAKGVTSEGKLSKFADEIKQITTQEPDWYIVNKFRYPNGNEALCVRTSDKDAARSNKYQMVEIGGGVTRDNDINSRFNYSYNDDFGITNGTYFPRETAYRSFTTRGVSNVVFDGHNDNLKLRLRNGKDIVFNDVNAYNWLKGYRNQPLADFDTLYLKSDGINNIGAAKTLKDFLASSNETRMSTLGQYGQNPLLLIDSSIMVQAMNFREMSKIGFIYYSDKTVDAISLTPISYMNTDSYASFYENKEQWYGNLSPGNYVHLIRVGSKLLVVFIGANFVIDDNNQKHKNIEVYTYGITQENGNEINGAKTRDKPFELYLTFSKQAQQQSQQASSAKLFRKKVLVANGTPEPRASNFLTGQDALISFKAQKQADNAGITTYDYSLESLFLKKPNRNSIGYKNPSGTYSSYLFGKQIASGLAYDMKNGVKTTGFIRLNEADMFTVEIEKATDDVKNFLKTSQFKINLDEYKNDGTNNKNYLFVVHNGFPGLNNRTILFVADDKTRNVEFYYLKRGSGYITNDWYSATQKTHYIYLTSDADTQAYLNSKSLSDIWTEINSLNKDDFEAYSED